MNYRKFGNTDLQVSEIGFGAWAIGGNAMIGDVAIGWGKSDDHTSKQAIKAALDRGINFFDTADIYGLGHSEQLIGETIGNSRQVIIASKAGNVSRNNQFTVDYSYQHIINACEASLKRLKREAIDYYQLHTARLSHLQQGDCIGAMQTLQQQGKIRYWGLSLNTFEPGPEAEYLLQQKQASGFQLVFNIINQKALPLLTEAAKNGYGIIARMPLQFGLLTGKFTTGSTFDKDDHRQKRLTAAIIGQVNEALSSDIWHLCDKYDISKTSLAISFILSYEGVSTVIPGIRTANHAKDNTSGLVILDKADRKLIEDWFANHQSILQSIQQQG